MEDVTGVVHVLAVSSIHESVLIVSLSLLHIYRVSGVQKKNSISLSFLSVYLSNGDSRVSEFLRQLVPSGSQPLAVATPVCVHVRVCMCVCEYACTDLQLD